MPSRTQNLVSADSPTNRDPPDVVPGLARFRGDSGLALTNMFAREDDWQASGDVISSVALGLGRRNS